MLIEDCCEGFGGSIGTGPAMRPIGSFGRAGVFGFYPNKQITTGEGGMIVTDDDDFADICRALRNQGREGMAWLAHQRLGYNYRLSEINAALGVAQMAAARRNPRTTAGASPIVYIERLMTNRYLILPTLQDDTHMSWFVFVVRLNDLFEPGDRDEIMLELRAEGIGCSNYFPPDPSSALHGREVRLQARRFPRLRIRRRPHAGAAVLRQPHLGASGLGLQNAQSAAGEQNHDPQGAVLI